MSDTVKGEICNYIDSISESLLDVSHYIHANPELAFDEHKASTRLCETLDNFALPVQKNAYGLDTAFESLITEDSDNTKTLDLLAEYDALPGIGHACGHNLIATASLGAALALSKYQSAYAGSVRLLGTPAEEKGGGKELMARNGAFENTSIAMMIHPSGSNLVTMPSLCVAEVEVVYHGRSAHASAMPHTGINALDGLLLAYQGISNLRQHIKPTERIHGIITEGGLAPNIVPDLARGLFYVRASNEDDLLLLKPRVQACFKAGATASGSTVEVNWAGVDYLDLNTNWPLAASFQTNAEALGREFYPLEKLPSGYAGSTDMGNVSYRVPSIHPMLASAPRDVVIHHPDFEKWAGSETGDSAALDGAKALAMTAIDYFSSGTLRTECQHAFDVSTGLQ